MIASRDYFALPSFYSARSSHWAIPSQRVWGRSRAFEVLQDRRLLSYSLHGMGAIFIGISLSTGCLIMWDYAVQHHSSAGLSRIMLVMYFVQRRNISYLFSQSCLSFRFQPHLKPDRLYTIACEPFGPNPGNIILGIHHWKAFCLCEHG
jgi:hypothetical protein